MTYIIFSIVLSYLLGSFPSSVWLGKALKGVDVRDHGSGNAGATNTFRVLGWKVGLPVLLLDIAKGMFAARLSNVDMLADHGLGQVEMALVFGFAAVIGHLFPVFARFNGGKGVATFFGVLIGAHPASALISLAVFLLVFLAFRFVSLASIVTALLYPVQIIIFHNYGGDIMIGFSILVFLVVFLTHTKNINRLLNGTENKIQLSKNK